MNQQPRKRKAPPKPSDVPMKTREFKSVAMIPARPTFKRRVRSFYKKNKTVCYTFLGLFVIMVITVVGVWSTVFDVDLEVERAPSFWLKGPIDESRFLSVFLSNNFGKKGPEFLQSFRISGEMYDGKTTRDFSIIKKRPDLALLKVQVGRDATVSYGFNGDVVWSRVVTTDASPEVSVLSEEQAEGIKEMGEFFSPFIRLAIFKDAEIYYLGLSDDLGYKTVFVEFENTLKNCRSVAHLDISELTLIARVDAIAENEETRVEYFDYRTVDGIKIPYETVIYRNEELIQRIRLDKAHVNPGVISPMFEVPGALR